MSSTNKTTNIELSQYIATDKPTYLVDYNGDMLKIDNAIGADRDSIATAQNTANTADEKADANATAIQAIDSELNDPASGITARLTDVVGDVNTIESLIGNGEPTAGDHTLIGAANTNTAAIGDLTQLSTTVKNNLVSALNEVAEGSGKDIIIISASYGQYPSAQDNAVTKLASMLDEIYDNVYHSTHGGDKFSDGSFLTQLQALTSSVTDPGKVSTILVVDIANDIGITWTTTLNAMIAFNTYCKTTYPNAKVFIAPCDTRKIPTEKEQLWTLFNEMLYFETSHKMTLLSDVFNIMGASYTSYVGSDGIHPNSDGASLIASAIYNSLLAGGFDFSKRIYENFLDASYEKPSYVTLGNIAFLQGFKDNSMFDFAVQAEITFTEQKSIAPGWGIASAVKLFETKEMGAFNGDYAENLAPGRLIKSATGDSIDVVLYSHYDSDADKYFIYILTAGYGRYTLDANEMYKLSVYGRIPTKMI